MRNSLQVAAAAEAALAASVCLAFLPAPLLFLAPLAAATFLLPPLLYLTPVPTCTPSLSSRRSPLSRAFPSCRRSPSDCAIFAPDPLSPDFAPLASALRDMLEDACVTGARRRIILSPLPSPDGGFSEYRILWRPSSSSIEIEWNGAKSRRKTAAAVFPAAPMPVTVGAAPVSITTSPDPRTGRVSLSQNPLPRPLRFLNPAVEPVRSLYFFYLAALFTAYRLFVTSPTGILSIAIFAVAPVLCRRLSDFSPRIVARLSSFHFRDPLA